MLRIKVFTAISLPVLLAPGIKRENTGSVTKEATVLRRLKALGYID